MEPEKRFKKLVENSGKITLSKEEKEALRYYLVNFMKRNFAVDEKPVEQTYYAKLGLMSLGSYLRTIINPISRKPVLQYGFLSFLIFIFLGFGVSFAAKDSLPGDLLYPVKTEVNERVLGIITFSSKGKAEYSIGLTSLRLEEMERLAIEDKLDDKTSKNINALFNRHISNAKNHIEKIYDDDNELTAVVISSDLEASLNAHSGVLNKISGDISENDSKKVIQKNNINKVLSEIKDKAENTARSRQSQESRLFIQSNQFAKKASEEKLEATEKKIQEVSEFIENKKSKISVNTYSTSETNLKLAKDTLLEGKAKLDSESYNEAFALFQSASRIAQEAKIYVATEANLKVKLDISVLNRGNKEKPDKDNDN